MYINNEINFHKKKISATKVELSLTLVPFSVRLRLLEKIFSLVIINHFLIIHTYSIVMTDIYAYNVSIACLE